MHPASARLRPLDFDGTFSTTDTPAIRLDQSNAGGFTAQTWDIGGNEANFFVRDTTGGSRLPFRIRPGAPTSSIDIAASGNVGIGTASPTAKLFVKVDPTANEGVIIGDPAVVTTNKATLHVEGTAYIAQTIEIGSSRARKENIRELTLAEAQAAVRDLKPVQFNYKKDPQTQLGFIAEDVPELVATKNRNSVIPMDFVAVLTKVVQEQQKREDELNATVRAQQELLKKMEARLEKLEHLGSLKIFASQPPQFRSKIKVRVACFSIVLAVISAWQAPLAAYDFIIHANGVSTVHNHALVHGGFKVESGGTIVMDPRWDNSRLTPPFT